MPLRSAKAQLFIELASAGGAVSDGSNPAVTRRLRAAIEALPPACLRGAWGREALRPVRTRANILAAIAWGLSLAPCERSLLPGFTARVKHLSTGSVCNEFVSEGACALVRMF